MIVYINGDFLPKEEAKLSPFDRGFLFADGVYEVIRTYNGKLFRYEDHMDRLRRSMDSIKLEYDLSSIKNIIHQLIEYNNLDKNESLIYIQITRGISVPRSHKFPESVLPTIFISTTQIEENDTDRKKGISIITLEDLRWKRCDIKSVSLLPTVLSNEEANKKGAREAILFRDGLITEGTHTNFFAAKDETIFTAPEGNHILSGITRKIVLELCNQLDIPISEEFIKKDKLKTFEEFFVTSTTKEITPVIKIDSFTVSGNQPGQLTMKLQNEFGKLTITN